MEIASLFGSLGVRVDKASFAAADAALKGMHQRAKRVFNAAHFHNVLTAFDPSRQVKDAVVSWDGWKQKVEDSKRQATDWKKVWSTSIMDVFKVTAGVFVGVHAALRAIASGDDYNNAISRIRQLTTDTQKQVEIENKLFQSAQDTSSAFRDVVKLYQQVGKGALDLGKTHEEAIAITTTISKAIKASGADPQSAASALVQLSQGLAAGALRGQEYNSVIEQAPVIIDLIAKSMGKTRGEMRKMANEGKLTSKIIFKALEEQAGAVDEAFRRRIVPVSDQFVKMRNAASQAFGRMLQDKEVAKALGDAIQNVGGAVMLLIQVFGDAVKFLARHTDAVKAVLLVLTAAFTAMAIKAAIAWAAVFGPITLVLAALAGLVLYWDEVVAAFVAGIEAVVDGITWIGEMFASAGRGIIRGFTAVVRFFGRVASSIRSFFLSVFTWVSDKFTSAINWITDKLLWLVNTAIDIANALPGVNIDRASIVAGVRPPAATRVPTVAPGQATSNSRTVNVGPTTINVQSQAKDPKAVANEVNAQQRAYWDRQLRQADEAP